MPVFEAAHAEVDGSGKLQQYGAINMKKNRFRGAWKRGDWCKKMNEKSTVCS